MINKVIIAAPTFQSVIHTIMCEHFRKLFKQDEMTLRSVTDEADEQRERLKRALMQTKATALIAMDIRPDPETINEYSLLNVPIVLIDEDAPGLSTISVDNLKGGRIAGDYLAKSGRKKIAIVTGRMGIKGGYNAEQRFKGFEQALNSRKLAVPVGGMIEVPHYSREDGLDVMPRLLQLGVDAIFCAAGDNCAQGLLAIAKERGVKVPEDVAIIGFDDLLIAQLSNPSLTTVKQPLEKMAEAAYKMTIIHRDEILRKPQRIVFDPELVIRKSA